MTYIQPPECIVMRKHIIDRADNLGGGEFLSIFANSSSTSKRRRTRNDDKVSIVSFHGCIVFNRNIFLSIESGRWRGGLANVSIVDNIFISNQRWVRLVSGARGASSFGCFSLERVITTLVAFVDGSFYEFSTHFYKNFRIK